MAEKLIKWYMDASKQQLCGQVVYGAKALVV